MQHTITVDHMRPETMLQLFRRGIKTPHCNSRNKIPVRLVDLRRDGGGILMTNLEGQRPMKVDENQVCQTALHLLKDRLDRLSHEKALAEKNLLRLQGLMKKVRQLEQERDQTTSAPRFH